MSAAYSRVSSSDDVPGTPATLSPPSLTSSLRELFSRAPATPPDAVAAARAFAASLSSHGPHVPPLFLGSYVDALRAARLANRPALLYVQSDIHADGASFLSGALCTAEVCAAITRSRAIVWGGAVHEKSGWDAARSLDVAGFPFLGLYTHDAGGERSAEHESFVRVWALEGDASVTADALVCELDAACATIARPHRATMEATSAAARRAALPTSSPAQALRAEQERCGGWARKNITFPPTVSLTPTPPLLLASKREYQQALEADRLAERAATSAALAEAERTHAALDAEELERAVKLSIELEKEGALGAARARLAASAEPVPTDTHVAVRLVFPSGVKVQRRFSPTATVSLVADYALTSATDVGAPLEAGSFDLATAQPRRVFNVHERGSADGGRTLAAAGLAPASTLLVTPNAASTVVS